jgi:lytic murein transglycosylase
MFAVAAMSAAPSALAKKTCQNTGSFSAWKRDFRRVAAKAGVSERTLQRAYDPVTFDAKVIRRDRRQSFFSLTFVEFSKRLVSGHRLRAGAKKMQQRRSLFRQAQQRYGVPAEVITAFWALESDFGAGISKQYPIYSALATLAYDCRRPEMFREELLAALKIVDDGYLPLDRMTGSWAGELGQTQFLPSHYYAHAVDADGDGIRDLARSDADIIMSTAKFIQHLGWRAGEPWLQEVRAPRDMPWQEADLAIQHPRAQWAKWGVRERDGGQLKADGVKASLLLPMGRYGPAFLAYHNFSIYPQWNQSLNYAITAAYSGDPAGRGRALSGWQWRSGAVRLRRDQGAPDAAEPARLRHRWHRRQAWRDEPGRRQGRPAQVRTSGRQLPKQRTRPAAPPRWLNWGAAVPGRANPSAAPCDCVRLSTIW